MTGTTMALTITTNQIQGWGLTGGAIIILATIVIVKLAKSVVGKLVWTLVVLMMLGGMWMTRVSIESSVKACNPSVLGVHLQISNPATRAQCADSLSGNA
jgi:hypothetical protein